MTPEQFVYWLQGMFELGDPKSLSEAQTAMIREHLKLVFEKVTPDVKSSGTTPRDKASRDRAVAEMVRLCKAAGPSDIRYC